MADYTPLDLARWSNLLPRAFPGGKLEPLGPQTLRGLPFDVSLIQFGPDDCRPLEIPVRARARWVIVAHRLLESYLQAGEPPGRLIASYRFCFADGQAVVVPIRERFEIAIIPATWSLEYWGQMPFLAVPDRFDYLFAREAGRWEHTGIRQIEAMRASGDRFSLWAWANPYPDRELGAIQIEPRDRTFLIGGITLSTLAENPFGREPRRPVKITLMEEEKADRRFDLAVEVDRGTATYPYPLPRQDAAAFLNDALRGWGQPYANHNSPAYTEIAALPSATVAVKSGEQELARVRWGDVLDRGVVQTPAARVELAEHGRNWVHVMVVDDETGQPLPCRIHFRSPDGIPYQPHGHHDHLLSDMGTWHIDLGGDLRLGHVTYAYIDGRCQGWLPTGDVLVDVAQGFEYEPLRSRVTIQPGQRELTLRLRRWADLNAEGWYSGDTHVHFLSTYGAHVEAQGEGLNVINLLQSQWGHLFTSTEEFVGRPVSTPDGRTIVYTSQENRQHMLGHLTLLGLKQPVMPWCSDGPDEAELGGGLETTLSHWADACHAQGGTVIIPHMPVPNGEPAALIATSRADAVEFVIQADYPHLEYYRYLNGGYRLPLVGGTDKMTADVPAGLYRTYVYIPPAEGFDYETWCRHLRQGRTFISSGPLLRFSVEGARIGDTLHLPGNGGTVEVEAEARSIFPIHTLQIVQEGRVVAATEEPNGADRLTLKARLTIDHHTWLAARAGGPGYFGPGRVHLDTWGRPIMAHTSPIYLAVGGEWWMASQETAQYMLTLLEGGLEYIRQRAPFVADGSVSHHHGEADHRAYLERPFHEAIAAVHRHLHRR